MTAMDAFWDADFVDPFANQGTFYWVIFADPFANQGTF